MPPPQKMFKILLQEMMHFAAFFVFFLAAKSLCHATRNNSTAIDDATLQLFALIICYFKKLLTATRKYVNAPGMKMHRL